MKITPTQLLFSQGFGTRRDCESLLRSGALRIADAIIRNDHTEIETHSLHFWVNDEPWSFAEKAYVMMNKPAGMECSAKPKHWPSVYEQLPAPLRNRPVKGGENGVQAVGRLDQDTTGLLLLSDDGHFIHRMNSPKHHVPKMYRVTTANVINDAQLEQLRDGVILHDSPTPVRAAQLMQRDENTMLLTLTEGKYHQVKRMIAATGNHVAALHREQIGALALPCDLAPGRWRWLTADELMRAQNTLSKS